MTFSVGDKVWLEDRQCFAVVISEPILCGQWGPRQIYQVRLDDGASTIAEEGSMEASGADVRRKQSDPASTAA